MIIRSTVFHPFPEIRFGFSTRKGGVSPEPLGMNLSFSVGDDRDNVIVNRKRFFDLLRIDPELVALPRQQHSSVVKRVYFPGIYNGCDALCTDATEVFLGITVADCLPVFLYDPDRHVIAAIHAGWRGSLGGILPETIGMLVGEFEVKAEHLLAYLGPCASACCYEVGEEVAGQFDGLYVIRKKGMKPHLDLKSLNEDALLNAGVRKNHIEVSPHCTICESDLFHSHRRDGAESGRMMGVIGMIDVEEVE